VRGGDALFVEGVEAVDFVFFGADFEGGFAVETIYRHDGVPQIYDFGRLPGAVSPHARRKILV
jgi:hypothetical protein